MQKQIISMVDVERQRTVIAPVHIGTNEDGADIIEQQEQVETWTEREQVATLVDMTAEEVAAFEAERAPSLPAYAAAKRWKRETGGCVVSGHQVATDRESQSKLLAEFVAIGAGMRADPSPWKFADGEFATLTNAAMGAVILGVRAHVAGAFAAEMAVLAGIAAGTVTTTAEIDEAF